MLFLFRPTLFKAVSVCSSWASHQPIWSGSVLSRSDTSVRLPVPCCIAAQEKIGGAYYSGVPGQQLPSRWHFSLTSCLVLRSSCFLGYCLHWLRLHSLAWCEFDLI